MKAMITLKEGKSYRVKGPSGTDYTFNQSPAYVTEQRDIEAFKSNGLLTVSMQDAAGSPIEKPASEEPETDEEGDEDEGEGEPAKPEPPKPAAKPSPPKPVAKATAPAKPAAKAPAGNKPPHKEG